MLRLINVFTTIMLLCLFSTQIAGAHEFQFPDNKGTIILQGMGYAVRALEPVDNKQNTESMFYIKASPKTCFNVITDFKHYPDFMPDTLDPILLKKQEGINNYQLSLQAKDPNDHRMLIKWNISPKKSEKAYSLIHYQVQVTTDNYQPDPAAQKLFFASIPKFIWEIRLLTKEERYKSP